MKSLRLLLISSTMLLAACGGRGENYTQKDSTFAEPIVPSTICSSKMTEEECTKAHDEYIAEKWGDFAKNCALRNGFAAGYTCYVCVPPTKAHAGKCVKE